MQYKCSQCGRDVGRENLYVKKVSFHRMGKGGNMIKQRSVAWLCRDWCVPKDPAWQQKPLKHQDEVQRKVDA